MDINAKGNYVQVQVKTLEETRQGDVDVSVIGKENVFVEFNYNREEKPFAEEGIYVDDYEKQKYTISFDDKDKKEQTAKNARLLGTAILTKDTSTTNYEIYANGEPIEFLEEFKKELSFANAKYQLNCVLESPSSEIPKQVTVSIDLPYAITNITGDGSFTVLTENGKIPFQKDSFSVSDYSLALKKFRVFDTVL